MTNLLTGTLRISTSADVVETVPYLLGFHPHDSLVAVWG